MPKRVYISCKMDYLSREILMLGKSAVDKLKNSSVAVFGVGGVGGFAIEALCRCGVGKIAIFDSDTVSESNINRQIIATYDTVGKPKVSVMEARLKSINKSVEVQSYNVFYLPENAGDYDLSEYDYVIDAVDTVSAKIEIIRRAKESRVKVISCMGTGGKTDISALKCTDISKTSVCPLARVMRKELKDRNITDVKVVYSTEQSVIKQEEKANAEKKGNGIAPPSMIFVPAAAGLMLAKEVIFDLIKE